MVYVRFLCLFLFAAPGSNNRSHRFPTGGFNIEPRCRVKNGKPLLFFFLLFAMRCCASGGYWAPNSQRSSVAAENYRVASDTPLKSAPIDFNLGGCGGFGGP